ncbi:MAG: hypothetical protein WCG31_09960 [Deltaproteobacteria bacterium]|jgi:hypothetical protein
MGNLTDDMTRLRGEIDALRSDRGALMREMARGAKELAFTVSTMQADFAAAHSAMAKLARGERTAFVAAVANEVNSLLDNFSRDRYSMGLKGRGERGAFLAEMRRQVTTMRKETADDLMGGRLAWRCQNVVSHPVQLKMKKELVIVTPAPPIELPGVEEQLEAMPVASVEETSVSLLETAVEVTEMAVVLEPPMVEPTTEQVSWLDVKPPKTGPRGKRGKK